MTAHRLLSDFEKIDVGDGTVEKYVGDPETNGKILAVSNVIPTNGATGYAHDCIYLHLDGSGASTVTVNKGTKASAEFVPLYVKGPVPAIPEADENETDPANNSVIINAILAALVGHGFITIDA